MKGIAAILFSFFLLHAGAAHALAACLSHDGHFDHEFESHHSDSGIALSHDRPWTPSGPIIHCPSVERRLGPALQVPSLRLSRLNEVTWVHVPVLREVAFLTFRNGLWLEVLFRRSLVFSLPSDLPRHLFLSILQI